MYLFFQQETGLAPPWHELTYMNFLIIETESKGFFRL